MKPLHQPSGITRGLDFLIAENWSAGQALAVVELLDDLRERIVAHYQLMLSEVLREQRTPPGNPHPRENEADPF